MNTCTNERS